MIPGGTIPGSRGPPDPGIVPQRAIPCLFVAVAVFGGSPQNGLAGLGWLAGLGLQRGLERENTDLERPGADLERRRSELRDPNSEIPEIKACGLNTGSVSINLIYIFTDFMFH